MPDPEPASEPIPTRIHVDRSARTIALLDDDGQVLHREPIGIGRGGLRDKREMSDFVTPTGTFTVDLVVHAAGTHDAVSPEAVERFASNPDFAKLLSGEPGLPGLFHNMSTIDFDGDGQPDEAYGDAYIGLDGEGTGPKLRRHSKSRTPYWYSIALHGTPLASNLGAANSGGCVHVAPSLLDRLITEEIVTVGSTVTIADGPP